MLHFLDLNIVKLFFSSVLSFGEWLKWNAECVINTEEIFGCIAFCHPLAMKFLCF